MKSKTGNKSQLAKEFGVSRGSLYYQPRMQEKDLELVRAIREVHSEHPSYGHKRLAIALKINKKRILRVMKKFGIKPPRRRPKRPPKLDDQGNPASEHPNLVKNLCPIAPNIVWASDFTYIKFEGKFLYLATVTDIFTRRIVGWHIATRHDVNMIRFALEDAFNRTKASPEIIHSDQGSEYTSAEYLKLIEKHKIKISFSAKACPWQNGFQESLYSGFKLDLGPADRFENQGQLIEAIHLNVNYYNNQRIHTQLKMAPQEFLVKYLDKTNQVKTQLKGDRNLSKKRGT